MCVSKLVWLFTNNRMSQNTECPVQAAWVASAASGSRAAAAPTREK